ISPPTRWTTDSFYLAVDFVWDENGDGWKMARKYGLNSPRAVMCTTPETGELLYMFESGNKFYIWNQVDGDVWEITRCQDLNEILEIMDKKGFGSLKLKDIS